MVRSSLTCPHPPPPPCHPRPPCPSCSLQRILRRPASPRKCGLQWRLTFQPGQRRTCIAHGIARSPRGDSKSPPATAPAAWAAAAVCSPIVKSTVDRERRAGGSTTTAAVKFSVHQSRQASLRIAAPITSVDLATTCAAVGCGRGVRPWGAHAHRCDLRRLRRMILLQQYSLPTDWALARLVGSQY